LDLGICNYIAGDKVKCSVLVYPSLSSSRAVEGDEGCGFEGGCDGGFYTYGGLAGVGASLRTSFDVVDSERKYHYERFRKRGVQQTGMIEYVPRITAASTSPLVDFITLLDDRSFIISHVLKH
jgi:hypothetical protein